MTQLESDVIEIVAEESGRQKSQVSLDSTLLDDLGVDGDDAWELLERLHERYKVNFSEFEFMRHFRNEPCFKGPIYLFRKLKYPDEHIAAGKIPITVAALVAACEKRAWNYDI